MVRFYVNGKNGSVIMALPTSISEITEEYLNEVTKNVKIGDDYSLVGIVYRETLSALLLAFNQRRKDVTTNVVPIFIRSGKTSAEYINNIKIKSPLIVSPSDLALGHHVNCPANDININEVISYCEGDKNVYNEALKHKDKKCCFLEFKLIPNCNIHGSYDNAEYDLAIVDQYITPNTESDI